MLWTAVGIWIEPLRSTFDYGQINVLLVLAVLYAVYSARWWLSGLLVGLAAGVKLTPAVSGLYFVGARRWGAAVFSAVVFFGTVAVSALVVGDQTRYYFTELLGDADRWSDRNVVQPVVAWRISRILGHDAGYGPLVLAGIAVTAVLAVLAWRAIGGASDRLGAIVIVQLFGLLLSPISWTHHWVWLIPLMIWLLHGRCASGWAPECSAGLAGADPGRRAVAAELRAADHLGDSAAVVSGLGRPDLHRRDTGDAGVDRGYGFPTIWFISRAICRSFSVIPPSEWVTNAKVTVRQRISISG